MKRPYTLIPPATIEAWVVKNFDHKVKKGGAEYHICSPFDDDTRYKFCINIDKGLCNDWRGNEWAGPITKTGKQNCSFLHFVMLYRRISYPAALKEILGQTAVNYQRPVSESPDTASLPDGVEPLTNSTDKQAQLVIKWLKKRGYTDQTIAQYDLHHLGMTVYWPYHEFDAIMYWQARSSIEKRFQFPATPKNYLYGFDEIPPLSQHIILTESIFDQMTLGPQALAIGGAVLNQVQTDKIKLLHPHNILLAPDNDAAGIKSCQTNYQRLKTINHNIYISIPPALTHKKGTTKDFNDLYTKTHLTLNEIRAIFIKQVRKYP